MDVARLEQLKYDLLHGEILKHRRLLMITGVFMFVFMTATLVGGYFVVIHAMDDNQITNRRAVDTPSQVSLLFVGHRPYDLINDIVYLNRIKLSPTPEGNVYYAADDSGSRMLVIAPSSKAPGDERTASVMGTVRPVTPALLKKWKLSKDEQKAIKAQGVYLEADSVKVQKDASTLASK
jgi:hypothetical protein